MTICCCFCDLDSPVDETNLSFFIVIKVKFSCVSIWRIGKFCRGTSCHVEIEILKSFEIGLVACFITWFSEGEAAIYPPDLFCIPSDLRTFCKSLGLLTHFVNLFSKSGFLLFRNEILRIISAVLEISLSIWSLDF